MRKSISCGLLTTTCLSLFFSLVAFGGSIATASPSRKLPECNPSRSSLRQLISNDHFAKFKEATGCWSFIDFNGDTFVAADPVISGSSTADVAGGLYFALYVTNTSKTLEHSGLMDVFYIESRAEPHLVPGNVGIARITKPPVGWFDAGGVPVGLVSLEPGESIWQTFELVEESFPPFNPSQYGFEI